MVRVGAFGLRVGLRHVRARLGLAVIVGSIAVVHITRRIDPYQTRATARRLGHCRSFGRRRSLRGGGSLRSWSRSRSCRSGGSCLSCCSRCRLRCSSGCRLTRRGRCSRIPLLHALVATARPRFACSRRIRPVLTLSGRAGRRRRLSYRCLCNQQTCRHRNKTNRCFHGFSKIRYIGNDWPEYRKNPTLPRPTCHQKAESGRGKGPPYTPNG